MWGYRERSSAQTAGREGQRRGAPGLTGGCCAHGSKQASIELVIFSIGHLLESHCETERAEANLGRCELADTEIRDRKTCMLTWTRIGSSFAPTRLGVRGQATQSCLGWRDGDGNGEWARQRDDAGRFVVGFLVPPAWRSSFCLLLLRSSLFYAS